MARQHHRDSSAGPSQRALRAGAWAGASLQSRIPESRLRRLLGWLALLIAARYLYLGAAG